MHLLILFCKRCLKVLRGFIQLKGRACNEFCVFLDTEHRTLQLFFTLLHEMRLCCRTHSKIMFPSPYLVVNLTPMISMYSAAYGK